MKYGDISKLDDDDVDQSNLLQQQLLDNNYNRVPNVVYLNDDNDDDDGDDNDNASIPNENDTDLENGVMNEAVDYIEHIELDDFKEDVFEDDDISQQTMDGQSSDNNIFDNDSGDGV